MRCFTLAAVLSLILAAAQLASAQSTLIPVPDRRDHVYVPQTHTLYITTESGDIQRYDVQSQQMLSPWHVGTLLRGIDVTPDGQTLVVCDMQTPYPAADGIGIIHEVNTSSGQVTTVQWDRTNHIADSWYEAGSWDVSVVSNTRVLFTSRFNGTGYVPLRELDLLTNQVTQRWDTPGQPHWPQGGSTTEQAQLAHGPDRAITFVQHYDRNTGPVFIIDTATDQYTYNIETGGFGLPNNFALYSNSAVNRNSSLIAYEMGGAQGYPTRIFDSQLNTVRDLSGYDGGIVFDPVRDILYTADSDQNLLVAIDTNTWQPLFTRLIWEDINPSGIFSDGVMSISSDGSYVFMSTPEGVRVIAVPEPALAGACAGLAVILCAGYRRTARNNDRRRNRHIPARAISS